MAMSSERFPPMLREESPIRRADVLLVCSTGGHLLELLALRSAWEDLDRIWVTFDRGDAHGLLAGERVVFAFGPTNRNVKNLLRNLFLAWRVLGLTRPCAVVSTGAGVAVPFAWLARVRRTRVVYIESLTRVGVPSLSGRLIAPFANRLYVQWPDLVNQMRNARFKGNVFTN